MSTPLIFALIIGVLIIVCLAVYAAKLLLTLKKQKAQANSKAQELIAGERSHDQKVIKSIIIIVRAMQAEQCDYSEGCWRLCVLLDSLKTLSGFESQFPSVFEFYNGIKHLAILEARKKLPKPERMKQDLQRLKIESSLTPKVKDELPTLATFMTEQQVLLNP